MNTAVKAWDGHKGAYNSILEALCAAGHKKIGIFITSETGRARAEQYRDAFRSGNAVIDIIIDPNPKIVSGTLYNGYMAVKCSF